MTDSKAKAEEKAEPKVEKPSTKATDGDDKFTTEPATSNTKSSKDADNDVKTRDLYNANDGVFGRQGGPYLDEVEQLQHEILQSAREGKKPDLDNPRSYPGIQLKTLNQQIADFNPTLIAGDDRRDTGEGVTAIPVVKDVPVTGSVLADFSITDTEDKGDETLVQGDLPVEGDPNDENISKASLAFLV